MTRIGKATTPGRRTAARRRGARERHRRRGHHDRRPVRLLRPGQHQPPRWAAEGPREGRHQVRRPARARATTQYPQPVVVIEDTGPDGGADEGRAMLQIAHDIAPASKLCYATAFISEVGFANNIRRLADQQGACGADVIVDDVGYYDEPFFSDGIISDAVDDVTAQGVHYFSAAGNSGEDQSWDSARQPRPGVRGPSWHQPRLQRCRPGALRRRAAGHELRLGHRRGPGRAPR